MGGGGLICQQTQRGYMFRFISTESEARISRVKTEHKALKFLESLSMDVSPTFTSVGTVALISGQNKSQFAKENNDLSGKMKATGYGLSSPN